MDCIDRTAFVAEQRRLHCAACERRKGRRHGQVRFLYAIGDAPCRACDIGDMIDAVEDAPAVDVVPARRGRWMGSGTDWTCSECSAAPWWCGVVEDVLPTYCPNCGALMDKDGD